MKRNSLLIAVILAVMVLCAGNIGSTAQAGAPSCSVNCIVNYNICTDSCNGDPICLADCQEERDCCLVICHGGVCLKGSSASTPGKAESLKR